MFTESLGKVVSNFQFEHLIVMESMLCTSLKLLSSADVTLTIHSWLELIKQRGVEAKR